MLASKNYSDVRPADFLQFSSIRTSLPVFSPRHCVTSATFFIFIIITFLSFFSSQRCYSLESLLHVIPSRDKNISQLLYLTYIIHAPSTILKEDLFDSTAFLCIRQTLDSFSRSILHMLFQHPNIRSCMWTTYVMWKFKNKQ